MPGMHLCATMQSTQFLRFCDLILQFRREFNTAAGFPPPVIVVRRQPGDEVLENGGWDLSIDAFGKIKTTRSTPYTLCGLILWGDLGGGRNHYTARVLGPPHKANDEEALQFDDIVKIKDCQLMWWDVDGLTGCGVPHDGFPNRWWFTKKDRWQPVLLFYVQTQLLRKP